MVPTGTIASPWRAIDRSMFIPLLEIKREQSRSVANSASRNAMRYTPRACTHARQPTPLLNAAISSSTDSVSSYTAAVTPHLSERSGWEAGRRPRASADFCRALPLSAKCCRCRELAVLALCRPLPRTAVAFRQL